MKPLSTKAYAIAKRDGWDPARIKSDVDARAVIDAGCWYDSAAADRVVNFFHRLLRHSVAEWAGKPFQLLEWQEQELIRPLFGWRRADGTRRFRRGGIWIPKKNGKSTLAAGIELYMLIGDKEIGAEVYTAANDRQQAAIIYKHVKRMVELSPTLRQRIGPKGIIPSTKTIYDSQTGSTLMALSADAPTKEGLNTHALIVDEIHAMKARALWDALVYGGASRRQALILSISTAGVYDPVSIGWEQYDYARQIANGVNDTDWSFFQLIYEVEKDADWTSPDVWKRANPSYGLTVKTDAFAEECREAQAEPKKQNAFRRYRLNQWVQQLTRWIPLDVWDENWPADHAPVTAESMAGQRCDGGLDLGATRDLSAWVKVFECKDDSEALDVLARFWIPEAALSNPRNPNRELYQQWVDEGWLETTPGNVTDQDFIEAAIVKDAQVFDLRSVGIDKLFQGQQLMLGLADEGIEVFPIGQSAASQGPPTKELERKWNARKIHHGGNPILRWMADNCEVKEDSDGKLKIVKPNTPMDPRKVDGMTALVSAIDRTTRYITDGSVYDDPDYALVTA